MSDVALVITGAWPAVPTQRGISLPQPRQWMRGLAKVHEQLHPDALLRQAAAGDRAAYTQLYDVVAPMVFGIALRVVRDRSRAEEVAQEAMIDIWQRAPRFDSARGSAKGWIATIAHRRAVDAVRSEQAARDRAQRVAVREPRQQHDVVAAEVEALAERSEVAAALTGLSDLQREAIVLAYYGGNTYQQVADGLGAPLGTVKTRMRDGLRRLAEILGDPDG